MVTIYKRDQSLVVPSGAFKSMYKPAGWSLEPPTPQQGAEAPYMAGINLGGSGNTSGDENPPGGPNTASEGEGGEPLSEEETLERMSDDELKQYASLLGVKTKNLRTREELLEAIKANKE